MKMEQLNFKDIKEFTDLVAEIYATCLEFNEDVQVVAHYEEAREIIKELLKHSLDLDISNIELEEADLCGYDKEYIISVVNGEIWCEKAWCGDKYRRLDGGVVYLLDNCSSKLVQKIDNKDLAYEVAIDYDYDEDGYDDEFDDYEDDNEDDDLDNEPIQKEVEQNTPCKCCSCGSDLPSEKKSSEAKSNQLKSAQSATPAQSKITYKINGHAVHKEEFEKAKSQFLKECNRSLDDFIINIDRFYEAKKALEDVFWW